MAAQTRLNHHGVQRLKNMSDGEREKRESEVETEDGKEWTTCGRVRVRSK